MDLFRYDPHVQTRWSSFENPAAGKGAAATANRGVKGSPAAPMKPGESKTLVDLAGPGVVRRIWLTVSDRSPQMLRSLRLDCFWDGEREPAVSVPVGDFFGAGLGRLTPFESELFCSPEGKSLCGFVPMPFRSHARIVLTNDSPMDLGNLFYDVNVTLGPVADDALYFHAHFRRERPTTLGRDFELLPRVDGRGRFLGTTVSVIADEAYAGAWFGEGEVKMFLDGDADLPTLCGTGTEDYIATGWGQGVFAQRFHGCTISDKTNRQWAFYRLHVPDPVVFHADCRVTLQQIGGARRDKFLEVRDRGAKHRAITASGKRGTFMLMETPGIDAAEVGDGWIKFQREDDVAAVAYFYLDRATNDLPPITPVAERTAGLLQLTAK